MSAEPVTISSCRLATAYPEAVCHGRQQCDKAATNGAPGEDDLLAPGVAEESLQSLLQTHTSFEPGMHTTSMSREAKAGKPAAACFQTALLLYKKVLARSLWLF